MPLSRPPRSLLTGLPRTRLRRPPRCLPGGGKETDERTNGIPAAGAPGATSVLESPATRETVVEDQPSTPEAPSPSRYLKIGDVLFVSIPGTASTRAPVEGEVFDEEVIATVGLKVVDEPSTSSNGSKEDQLLQAMSINF